MAQQSKFSDTHEVHLRRDGKWTIEHVGLSRREARDLSEEGFRQSGVDGLRIILSRESVLTGNVSEEVIAEKTRKLPPAEVIVGVIADAPYCDSIEHLFELPARYCLHRLFSGWLAAHEVGVTECLLSPKLMERLLDRGSLVQTAAQRVAGLQTPEGIDSEKRRDQLLSFIDQLRELTIIDASRNKSAASGAVETVAERVTRALETNNFIRAITQITETLSDQPNRLAKVQLLGEIIGDSEDQEVRNIVDLVLSDFMMDQSVVLELAGTRPFAIEALNWIAQAAQGVLIIDPEDDSSTHAFITPIVKSIQANLLPRCRQGMLFALEDLLKNETPLHDTTPGQEKAALLALTRCLAATQDFAGGSNLAARLTHRFATFEVSGGSTGFLEAADSLTLDLNDIHCQTRYLFALASGTTVGRIKQGLMGIIDQTLRLYGGLHQLAKTMKSPVDLVRELDGICLHLEAMELGPRTRDAWIGEITNCLAEVVDLRTREDPALPETLVRLVERGVLRSNGVAEFLTDRTQ